MDGSFRQTAETRAIRAIAGDRGWTDYTLELKACRLAGAENLAETGTARVLTHEDPQAEKSLTEPRNVTPRTETVDIPGPYFTREFPPHSFSVLRLPTIR